MNGDRVRETESELKKSDIKALFGKSTDDFVKIEDVTYKNGPWYSALAALTEEESQDVATGAEVGNGAKAWKKVVKRWDTVVAGRNRALQKTVCTSERCRIQDLAGASRNGWPERAKYEKREERGERLKLTRDLKMTTFENVLPLELQNHLVLNKKRLKMYDAQKEEIEGIINSRVGANFREVPMGCRRIARGGDLMDVNGWTTNKKGKSRGKSNQNQTGQGKFHGVSFNCHKPGHRAAERWSKTRTNEGRSTGGKGKTKDQDKDPRQGQRQRIQRVKSGDDRRRRRRRRRFRAGASEQSDHSTTA